MNDLDRTEIIHRLERRHEQLLEELDSLNERLDHTLAIYAPSSSDESHED